MNKAWQRREATHEKDMHKMQQGEKGNGIPVHQSSWTNAASILVRQLHEGILQGLSLGKTQEMRPSTGGPASWNVKLAPTQSPSHPSPSSRPAFRQIALAPEPSHAGAGTQRHRRSFLRPLGGRRCWMIPCAYKKTPTCCLSCRTTLNRGPQIEQRGGIA